MLEIVYFAGSRGQHGKKHGPWGNMCHYNYEDKSLLKQSFTYKNPLKHIKMPSYHRLNCKILTSPLL